MHTKRTQRRTGPQLAGATIVIREHPVQQVLLLQRHEGLRFMGGYWAFPGGRRGCRRAAGG
jgi:8-oxo-dGTP pyrophosphatase MutT (NUDIX family)